MKKSIKLTAKHQALPYRKVGLALLLLCSIIINGNAQKVKKTYVNEIVVSSNVVIKTTGPQSVNVTGKGAINTRQSGNRYIVSGRDSEPYIYVINKTLTINTWQYDKIKQVVEVRLECENQTQVQSLFDALRIQLKEDAAGQVMINCEMNIAQFKIYNSFFGDDDNKVILTDGKEYKVKYLELTTSLFIPENSKLILDSNRTDIKVGNHNGEIDLTMKRGSFIAKKINTLNANLETVKVDIQQLLSGDLIIKNTKLKLAEAKRLQLRTSLSTINIAKSKTLLIDESVNDKYIIKNLDDMIVEESLFSEYKISMVNSTLEMKTKNNDIVVDGFGKNASRVSIKNQNGVVQLDLDNLISYKLSCNQISQSTYKLPDKLDRLVSQQDGALYSWGIDPYQSSIDIDCKQCEVTIR